MSRRWRRLSRIVSLAVVVPTRATRIVSGNSETFDVENCTSSQRAQTRDIVCTSDPTIGPSTRTA